MAATNSTRMRWRTSSAEDVQLLLLAVGETRPHQLLGVVGVGERRPAQERLDERTPAELERGVERGRPARRHPLRRELARRGARQSVEAAEAAEQRRRRGERTVEDEGEQLDVAELLGQAGRDRERVERHASRAKHGPCRRPPLGDSRSYTRNREKSIRLADTIRIPVATAVGCAPGYNHPNDECRRQPPRTSGRERDARKGLPDRPSPRRASPGRPRPAGDHPRRRHARPARAAVELDRQSRVARPRSDRGRRSRPRRHQAPRRHRRRRSLRRGRLADRPLRRQQHHQRLHRRAHLPDAAREVVVPLELAAPRRAARGDRHRDDCARRRQHR